MKYLIFILTIILTISTFAYAENLNDDYPGTWINPFTDKFIELHIERALVAKKVKVCGEYYYKKHKEKFDKILVYCTKNGKTWNAFIVNISTKEVLTLDTPKLNIEPPR